VVSAAVFLGPFLETRRRNHSVRQAVGTRSGGVVADGGYQALFQAEERRAFRIAALMTGSRERATSIVEEAFAHLLQQWSRLSADRRVWYVLSTVVKRCLGSAFVGSLADAPGSGGFASEPDELLRAARTLAVLEPTRRVVVVLGQAEGLSTAEIAAVVGIDPARVSAELAAGLEQLGPVLATVAA
jgi:DNA-directed RNA polymerase specialized sigma24 family protein